MINTLNPSSTLGHDEKKGEVLQRLSDQYGAPEQKQRAATKKLGKDEFFKIMVTELQHQDPLKPQDNKEMAAQMAQFSSLEQMLNVNQNIEKLTQAQQPLQQLGAASLIGKYVTADSSRIMHIEGKMSDLKFELPNDAKNVTVKILNEKGESVREIQAHDQPKGVVTLPWDGKRSNSLSVPSGTYSMQVSAEDGFGKPMQVQMAKTEIVHGVGFEGKETVLFTGDPKSPTKLMLKNISKIVDPSQATKTTAAAPANPFQAMLDAQRTARGEGPGDGEEGDGQPVGVDAQGRPYQLPEEGQRLAEGVQAGQAENFVPFDGRAPQDSGMAPKMIQDAAPDEFEINPAAQDVRSGNLAAAAPGEFENINPAARQFASQEQIAQAPRGGVDVRDISDMNDAPAKSYSGNQLPSGQDGSIAGKLSE